MWFVYLLLCEGGSLYTGCTTDVRKRFLTHQKGKGAHYTRVHKPLSVIYQEPAPDRSAALKRELEIKSWSRADKIKRLQLVFVGE